MFVYNPLHYFPPTANKCYYIDRCELWGFIREINSGISDLKYQFFPAGTTFT